VTIAPLHFPDLSGDISLAELMDVCLSENDRRLSIYDPRLLRPRLVPAMVHFARRFLRTPEPKLPDLRA
jgi:hypothetical protein